MIVDKGPPKALKGGGGGAPTGGSAAPSAPAVTEGSPPGYSGDKDGSPGTPDAAEPDPAVTLGAPSGDADGTGPASARTETEYAPEADHGAAAVLLPPWPPSACSAPLLGQVGASGCLGGAGCGPSVMRGVENGSEVEAGDCFVEEAPAAAAKGAVDGGFDESAVAMIEGPPPPLVPAADGLKGTGSSA